MAVKMCFIDSCVIILPTMNILTDIFLLSKRLRFIPLWRLRWPVFSFQRPSLG